MSLKNIKFSDVQLFLLLGLITFSLDVIILVSRLDSNRVFLIFPILFFQLIIIVITLYVSRGHSNLIRFIITSFFLLFLSIPFSFLYLFAIISIEDYQVSQKYEEYIEKVRNTIQISNPQDSVLYSSKGNPIGIRVEYFMSSTEDLTISRNNNDPLHLFKIGSFEDWGAPQMEPVLSGNNIQKEIVPKLRIITVAFEPDDHVIQKGVKYRIIVDAVPEFLRLNSSNRPYEIIYTSEISMIELVDFCSTSYAIATIKSNTTLGDGNAYPYKHPPLGQFSLPPILTENEYNFKDFEKTIIMENVKTC